MTAKLLRVEFEVFGKVQNVFFRKYTQAKSQEIGLRGWCMNTAQNTVRGVIEGEPDKIKIMKNWLQHEGSPKSKIDYVKFCNEKPINEYSFHDFQIRR